MSTHANYIQEVADRIAKHPSFIALTDPYNVHHPFKSPLPEGLRVDSDDERSYDFFYCRECAQQQEEKIEAAYVADPKQFRVRKPDYPDKWERPLTEEIYAHKDRRFDFGDESEGVVRCTTCDVVLRATVHFDPFWKGDYLERYVEEMDLQALWVIFEYFDEDHRDLIYRAACLVATQLCDHPPVTFMALLYLGKAKPGQIDDMIAAWHDHSECQVSLPDFLGMSVEDYARFVEDAGYLHTMIATHKEHHHND
jgi:hypothetical protein